MEIKEIIKEKFGSVRKFADLLGAPEGSIYAWTRKAFRAKPSKWQFKAYIDAATYRSKRVAGWKCVNCGCVTEANQAGIRPPFCGGCGAPRFEPVSIVFDGGGNE